MGTSPKVIVIVGVLFGEIALVSSAATTAGKSINNTKMYARCLNME